MNKKNVLIINVENLEKATTLQDSDLNDPLVTSHLENTFPFGSMFFLAWLLPRCYTMSINKKMIMIINFDFLTTKLSPNNENQILNFKSKECIACNAPEIIMGLDKTFFYLEMLLH